MSNSFSPFRFLGPQLHSDDSDEEMEGGNNATAAGPAKSTTQTGANHDLSTPFKGLSMSLPSSFKNPEAYVRFLDECACKGRVDLIKQLSSTNRYDAVLAKFTGKPFAMPPSLSTFRELHMKEMYDKYVLDTRDTDSKVTPRDAKWEEISVK